MKKLFLFICLMATVAPGFAQKVLIDDLYYNLNQADKTAEVTYEVYSSSSNYATLSGDLVIPESVIYNKETYVVTSIGDYAFLNSTGFTGSLTIPATVTSIDEGAFRGCSGFTGSLTIPDAVTSIGTGAFAYCKGFTGSPTIGESVTSIGDLAFTGCFGFTGSLTIPDAVTSIGKNAFSGCSGFTGSLTIPDAVTSIGSDAFFECTGFNGSLTLGDGVTSIGGRAFSRCSGFTGSLIIPNGVTSIGNNAFYGCSGFTGSLTIGESVTSIGDGAFTSCFRFTGSLTIPDAVTSIGNYAFEYCTGFTGSLTIGNGVTTIGHSAFGECSGFTAIELGESLEKIGDSTGKTFLGCSNIESVTCHAVNPPVFFGSDNFENSVLQNAYLFVPAESSDLYAAANVWKDFVNRAVITDPVDPVVESLYMPLDGTLDLTPYFRKLVEGSAMTNSQTEVATVTADNIVEAHQYGHTTITYTLNDTPIATFDIYVCPTVTVEHGEGAVSTHFVLYNSRPTVYLEPANGYDIGGVTHDGDDITDAVTGANGYYTFVKPVTENTVINLAMVDNNTTTTGVEGIGTPESDMRVLVDGRTVSIVGMAAGDAAMLYDMSGSLLLTTENNQFMVDRAGIFLVKVGDKTFKIIAR